MICKRWVASTFAILQFLQHLYVEMVFYQDEKEDRVYRRVNKTYISKGNAHFMSLTICVMDIFMDSNSPEGES